VIFEILTKKLFLWIPLLIEHFLRNPTYKPSSKHLIDDVCEGVFCWAIL